MNIETDIKMIHKDELFKLVASELEVKDPDPQELEDILKQNEIIGDRNVSKQQS